MRVSVRGGGPHVPSLRLRQGAARENGAGRRPPITLSGLKRLSQWRAGDLPEDLLSEPVPAPGENDGAVTKVVTDEFAALVSDDGARDVMLLYYDPECPTCNEFLPLWEEFGRVVRAAGCRADVRVGRIDAVENEHPSMADVTMLPAVKLWRAETGGGSRGSDGAPAKRRGEAAHAVFAPPGDAGWDEVDGQALVGFLCDETARPDVYRGGGNGGGCSVCATSRGGRLTRRRRWASGRSGPRGLGEGGGGEKEEEEKRQKKSKKEKDAGIVSCVFVSFRPRVSTSPHVHDLSTTRSCRSRGPCQEACSSPVAPPARPSQRPPADAAKPASAPPHEGAPHRLRDGLAAHRRPPPPRRAAARRAAARRAVARRRPPQRRPRRRRRARRPRHQTRAPAGAAAATNRGPSVPSVPSVPSRSAAR